MARIKVNMDEIPDFVSMTPGRVRAKLIECNEDVSQQGNDMLVWKWEGVEGENEGRTINSYTSLLDEALGGLKIHLKALGFSGDVNIDTRKYHGKTAILIVVSRKYRDRDTGEEREGSSVANVLPDSKAPAVKSKMGTKVQTSDDGIPY